MTWKIMNPNDAQEIPPKDFVESRSAAGESARAGSVSGNKQHLESLPTSQVTLGQKRVTGIHGKNKRLQLRNKRRTVDN